MTNFEKIKQMSIEEMVKNNVRKIQVSTYANDGDGYVDEWEEDMYVCSDGTIFSSQREGIIHE